MSITGISTSLTQLGQSGASYFSQLKDAWQSLQASLQSGDVESANTALASIQSLQQKYQSLFATQDTSTTKKFDSDMQALSDALGKGDMESAKTAFTTLKSDFDAQRQQFAREMTTAVAASESDLLQELLGSNNSSSDNSNSTLLDSLTTAGKNLDVIG